MTKLKPRAAYLLLLAIQIAGLLFVVWRELPDLRQLMLDPGFQLPYMRSDDFATSAVMIAMQVAYWYRLQRIPIPFENPNVVLSHLFMFLGRLSFIFGGAIFSVVFFRHLPNLDGTTDAWLLIRRAAVLGWTLFALFCVSLELDRLGHAFENDDQN